MMTEGQSLEQTIDQFQKTQAQADARIEAAVAKYRHSENKSAITSPLPDPIMPMGKPEPSIADDFAYAEQHKWDGYMTASEFLLPFSFLLFIGAWAWRYRKTIAKKADDVVVSAGAQTLKTLRATQDKAANYAQRISERADQKSNSNKG